MATVSRGNETEETKVNKPVFIDPFGSDVEAGEVRKLNPDANPDDAWGSIAPPPKGFYNLRMMPLAKDSTQKKASKNDDTFYYSTNVEFQVVSDNKEVDGATVYGQVVSYISRGRELSTMAALVKKAGYKIKDEMTDGQLVTHLGKVSLKQPIMKDKVCINWQGSYKRSDGTYENVFTDYDQFPDDGKGGKLFEVSIMTPEGRKDITARANIQWNAKEEEVKPVVKGKIVSASGASAPAKATVVTPSIDDLDAL